MNIKNIAFSGFAAAILAGVCGAADAATVNLASKSYVDNALAGKASIEDFENLESTVGQKATQTALKEVADQVVINTNDIAALKAAGYLTDADLTELQQTLQAAIDEKQAKGNYADADELATLKTTVENLQTGNVDKTVIENLQTTVNTISADYSKKSELTASEERLQSAIDAIKIPDLTDYAKTADVNAALASKADASALTNLVTSTQLSELRSALETEIAKKQNSGDYATADALQTVSDSLATLKGDVYTKAQVDAKIADAISGGEIDLSGYAKQVDLDSLTQLVSGHTTEINALKNAGYQTSDDVQGAITTAVADLATDADLNTLKTTLEAAIDDKQAKGDYLVAADLKTLEDAVTALQSGKADASTVATIQESISKLGDTYASKADMTAADEALQAAIDAINVPSLEGYVKASDLAAVATSGSYADLSDKPTIPSIEGLATSEQLTTLQTTLQAAIDEKQAAGEYLVAADLTTLNDAITALQSGKADASTVTTIQETISKLGDTYATKDAMTAADAALQAAIDNMDLSAYAKVADVYSKTEADAKFLIMRDANALGANLQWDEDGKLNTKGIATAEGLEDLENKVADAVTQTELDAKGYLTAESVTSGTENGTIAVNGSDVAVKGLGSAAYTTAENYIIKPTEQPNTFGEYVLILNINEAGESEGYSWLDTLDLMGDSGFDM
ncbi:MAG: hypothetical protein IJX43_03300 [Alphaproteobacteria bacterium]|nr:hypothetical protein [Alphaproteobacteria bacterium]